MRIIKVGAMLLAGALSVSVATPSDAAFVDGLYATGIDLQGIIRVDSDGAWETTIPLPSGPDHKPVGLAFLDRERLAVTLGGWRNGLVGRLSSFDSEGNILTTVNGIPATNRWSNGSWGWGFAVDDDGTYYIATWNTPGATKITPDGNVSDWTGYQHDLWWGRDVVLSPSGELYITNGLEGGNPAQQFGSIHRIDKQTGEMATVLEGIDWVSGIEFNANGDMFFTQIQQNEVWRLDSGTTIPYSFADVPLPGHMTGHMTMGYDDLLYVVGADAVDGDNQIWQVDAVTGTSTLFADDLPKLSDLAFLKTAVPEPSTLIIWSILGVLGIVCGWWRRR